MKILLTIKEYSKLKGLSQQAISKQVVSKLCESCTVNKITYIIYEDNSIEKYKQTIRNKNSQIRELKLKLEINNDNNKYQNELEKDKKRLLKVLEKRNKRIDKLEDKKDKIYEKALASILQIKQLN